MKLEAHPDSRLRRAHKLNRRSAEPGTGLHTYSSVLRVQYRERRDVPPADRTYRVQGASDMPSRHQRTPRDGVRARMLHRDPRVMNTFAGMSRCRFVALTMRTRRFEFRVGTAREDEARQTGNRNPTVVTTSVGEETWF
jgi:hypothetical protein